jgi:uncharacterized protein (TIGR02246 family)
MSINDPAELPHLFAERASAGDIEGLMALYEDGATLVGPDGVAAAGKQAIRERLEQLLAMTPRITPTHSRAMVVGDIALMSGSWQLRLGTDEGGEASFESSSTEVARRQHDGSWLYVIDDTTSTVTARGGELGVSFVTNGERWQERRSLARDFWTEPASER